MKEAARGVSGETPPGLEVGGSSPILRSLAHKHNQGDKKKKTKTQPCSLGDKTTSRPSRGAEGVGQLTGAASAPGPSLEQPALETPRKDLSGPFSPSLGKLQPLQRPSSVCPVSLSLQPGI